MFRISVFGFRIYFFMFDSRKTAGEQLAQKLKDTTYPQAVILGIPRGGVVVASEIARVLHLPLDVITVRKLSAPDNPELAVGALAPDGVSYIEWRFANTVGADEAYMKNELVQKGKELKKYEKSFRKKKKPLKVRDKVVFLVDDGAATGSTMEAAIKWAKVKKAHKIIAVLPVAAKDTVKRIRPEVDELVVLEVPSEFAAVGQFYKSFPQVTDEKVKQLLSAHYRDAFLCI